MNTTDYHYRVNQLHCEAIQRAVRRHQLARLATERRPRTLQAFNAALLALWASLFR